MCWIENWKRALSEFCSQSDNVGQERVLRQQETLTSFKTGDERSVRHWSPDKRFPTERKQHRTFSRPLEKTIANGSNLGPVWKREAKLGIGYKGRGEAGRIRKRAAFHSLPDTKVCLEVGVQISQRMCKMEQGLFVSVPKCCSQEMGGFPVHNEQWYF